MNFAAILLMSAIILFYSFQNFFCKKFSFSYPGKPENATPVLMIAGGFAVAFITFAFSGFKFSALPLTIVFGIINALATYGYNYFLIKASACGPFSVVIVLSIVGGIAIPAGFKWIFFDETLPFLALIFLLIVLIGVCLMSIKPNDNADSTLNKITPKFLIFAASTALCNGIYGTFVATQQELTGEGNKEEFVMVTYAFAAIFSLIMLIINKADLKNTFKLNVKSSLDLTFYSFSTSLAINSLVLFMLFKINTGILFTIQNSGIMLMSVILSYFVFKEKITKKNLLGCVIMAAGLVGIALFS